MWFDYQAGGEFFADENMYNDYRDEKKKREYEKYFAK